MTTAKEVIGYMESLQDEEQRKVLMRFFKTAKGEYGYGDEFLGLKVPQTREVVKQVVKDIALGEIPELLMCRWHEVRLCGLLIMVEMFKKLTTKKLINDENAIRERDEILKMYLDYADQANNWDLVDLSAPYILGHWLMLPSHISHKQHIIDELAQSDNLWRQRMSMVCTWMTSKMGDPSWCLRYAEIHLQRSHNLIYMASGQQGQSQTHMSYADREKTRLMAMAVGWMLREMGKRVSMDLLRDFLRQHIHEMPRTALRYAIEKMDDKERKYWMEQ